MKRQPTVPPRLDWRDPNMPVYVASKSRGMILMEAEEVQKLSARRLQLVNAPDWRNDPTYNLNKRKK